MKKRILSLFLAFVMLLGVLPSSALAAPTLEEAMAEVDIYSRDQELVWLTMNGKVNKQKMIYYNYESPATGQVREIPAYCIDPNLYGVPEKVSEGTPIKYSATETMSDYKLVGIVANGYPHQSLESFGLQTPEEGYYATKTAIWTYLIGGWSINGLGINPSLTGADRATAERVLQATKDIYWRGVAWNKLYTPSLTATADRDTAYPVTINGESYYQQVFTIESGTWAVERVKLSLANGAPDGAKILSMDDREISSLEIQAEDQCKVVYPAASVAGKSGSAQLNLSCVVDNYVVYYARTLERDKYGNIQDYLLDTDPYYPIEAAAISRYSADGDTPEGPDTPDTPDDPSGTALKITKLETGTETPLAGAVFEVLYPDGSPVGSFSTDRNGVITIPLSITGNYTVTEKVPPEFHLLPVETTQNVQVRHGETAKLTFWNDPYGNLRVHKVSDTGENLAGVTVQIKHIATGETRTAQTSQAGVAVFTELPPGGYEVRETAGIEGWIADTDTVQTVAVVAGEESSVTIVNRELPGLRIVKYDRKNQAVMPDVTFEVWRDGESLGRFKTNQQGEILLTNVQPGTYRAFEADTGDDGHILDTTPQEVELHAGDGIKELMFFNDVKPGLKLVKVDSANPSKVIPNAVFEIKSVAGDYGPEEFRTDQNGEIDLSKLPAGAYVVTEKACEGYIIDEAQRVIQLDPNENAEFVFTNTIKPSIQIVKYSSDGTKLPGVMFRIAKIEDGSHYLDRVTDQNGEINISDLEPGVYSVKETATVADHVLDVREYHVELFPGKTSTLVIENQRRPDLVVYKHDADTGEPIPGTIFTVRAADGHSVDEIKTDSEGKATLDNLLPGVYEISEKSVPAPWLMDADPQLVTLYPNRDHTVYFQNHKKPTLTVNKVDSITGSPIKGAKFEVWYGSNNTTTGELNSLGTFFSDENGQFFVDLLRDGWYKVTELEPAAGYTIKEPATQEFYIKGGENKTITFENVPKNAIIVEKYDSVTGAALPGCTFQLRYLGGTSGTGGTVIGTKVTGKNGTAMWTGLNPGAYVLEEIDAADGYNIIQSSETIMLADSGEQSVVTVRFTNAPDGQLLIRKVCSVNPSVTLQNAEFKVLYADGSVVGDSNGIFRTDENGEILITGLTPGKSVVVTETRAPAGFILDTQSQTVQIKEGRTVSLTFKNQPKGAIIIQKRDSATGLPLSGAEFRVTTAAGCEVGLDGVIGTSTLTQNGIFTTDAQGEIKITNLAPGAYVLTEVKAPTGYVMDSASTNVVIGQGGDTQTVVVKNSKAGTLVIDKRDSLTGKPLEGVTFKVTTSTGEFVPAENGQISSNGLYFTDKDGQITINGVVGTLVVTETATIPGYTIDEATRTQTVVVNPNDTQTLHFTNTPSTTLVIEKYIEGTTTPLKGVTFLITDSSGAVVGSSNGEFITDENGRIVLNDLTPGTTVTAREVKALEGYVLDTTPKSILIKTGEVQTLRFYNAPLSAILIHKIDSTTKQGIYGVTFLLYDANKNPIGQYSSDDKGYVYIDDLPASGRYYLRELENEGYIVDTQLKTVYVTPGTTTEVTWENTAITGQIQITKTSEDYNSMNGWPAGTPIPNTEFEIYHYRTGNLVDTIRTDKNGVAVSRPLPLGRYKIVESKAADFYGLDKTPIDVEIEHAGQIVKAAMTNKSLYTNVSIEKTGYAEVMPGQNIRYTFSNIGNNSTTALTSFYWRDTLPVEAVRLDKIVTGTYNVQGNYKIVFKTNLNGEYRTMYDNLSTMQNYVLEASPVALRLASNEYVTEVMFVFGVVPANFRQVEAPKIDCTVVSWAKGGSQFVNQADVGGVYNGQWVMATSRWVTRVYQPAKPLPRTGY